MNHTRVTDDARIIGLVVTDILTSTKQSKKKRRRLTSHHVKSRDVKLAVDAAQKLTDDIMESYDRNREEELEQLLNSGRALDGVISELKEGLSDSLNRSHDFLQLVKQIRGHVIAILETRYPGEPPEVAAEKLPMEGAIFFATELLQGKIDATIYLNEPNKIFGKEATFELHRFVTKYFRIYRSQTREKEVDLMMNGVCHGKVHYNHSAIGVVVQALLDNLVKYAPAGSKADIVFTESPDDIRLNFQSLGPRIGDEEVARIYLPGFRANAARQMNIAGLGLGLGAAKKVSDMLELAISVEQDKEESIQFPGFHLTEFSLLFDKVQGT